MVQIAAFELGLSFRLIIIIYLNFLLRVYKLNDLNSIFSNYRCHPEGIDFLQMTLHKSNVEFPLRQAKI